MERQTRHQTVNNDFYDELHEDWYNSYDHPIALLRAENDIRNPWILSEIQKEFPKSVSILDIGCGAGLLTNTLARAGHTVSGIDLSQNSLKTAEKYDSTRKVTYMHANAYNLPFKNESFDVVCAMDILEHVENPSCLISEASRVLKPQGLFFFHTFNRNPLSYLVIIKGVEWFVPNTPKNMHLYSLFIKPKELKRFCTEHSLFVQKMLGFRPSFSFSLFKMVCTKKIPKPFPFCFSKDCSTGYCGIARKSNEHSL